MNTHLKRYHFDGNDKFTIGLPFPVNSWSRKLFRKVSRWDWLNLTISASNWSPVSNWSLVSGESKLSNWLSFAKIKDLSIRGRRNSWNTFEFVVCRIHKSDNIVQGTQPRAYERFSLSACSCWVSFARALAATTAGWPLPAETLRNPTQKQIVVKGCPYAPLGRSCADLSWLMDRTASDDRILLVSRWSEGFDFWCPPRQVSRRSKKRSMGVVLRPTLLAATDPLLNGDNQRETSEVPIDSPTTREELIRVGRATPNNGLPRPRRVLPALYRHV